MHDPAHKPQNRNHDRTDKIAAFEVPQWLSTDEIEEELFLAAVGDSNSTRTEADFARIDAYFAADRTETEAEYRRSLVRLLADLRPQFAELIGCPRAKQ
jgi:hypothetical protein